MNGQIRPSVVRLLIYMIAAAGVAGGLSGWMYSSGTFDWMGDLVKPGWLPDRSLLSVIWIIFFQFAAISLWINQRTENSALKHLTNIMLIGLIMALVFRMYAYVGIQDVMLVFLITLAVWVYGLFTIGLVGRTSKTAGFLLWPMFIWLTYSLALTFELMRLNPIAGVMTSLVNS